MTSTAVILLFLLAVPSHAYLYKCLGDCDCDTDDEVIHCHSSNLETLPLPDKARLRGFPVIGATFNNIKELPSEAVLIEKFPDLKLIDVERNPFNCSQVNEYDRIKIISDCDKTREQISRIPKPLRPTAQCDLACVAKKHYDKLHEYVLQLWKVLQHKIANWDTEATLRDIRDYFNTLRDRLRTKLREHIRYTDDDEDEVVVPTGTAAPVENLEARL